MSKKMGVTRVLSRKLGADNIRVNTLLPGSTANKPESTLADHERSASKRFP
ncbi:MAG: hypothetical protein OXU75_02225 [Deltaproteobacteria bacterium]|nr:hypothetical protein [Deltaproteobacteria bacterium]